MLNALLSGRSLADGVVENDELDLSEWLPMAMQTGLVLGAKQHQSPND